MYRLKHKPTGLYYQAAKGYIWQKCHLSQTGKVYARKPQIPSNIHLRIGSGNSKRDKILLDHFTFEKSRSHILVKTPETDWEIIEVKI